VGSAREAFTVEKRKDRYIACGADHSRVDDYSCRTLYRGHKSARHRAAPFTFRLGLAPDIFAFGTSMRLLSTHSLPFRTVVLGERQRGACLAADFICPLQGLFLLLRFLYMFVFACVVLVLRLVGGDIIFYASSTT